MLYFIYLKETLYILLKLSVFKLKKYIIFYKIIKIIFIILTFFHYKIVFILLLNVLINLVIIQYNT